MDKATSLEPSVAEDSTNMLEAVGECIQRIDLTREHITRDQAEIDQLQSETRAILERLRVLVPAA